MEKISWTHYAKNKVLHGVEEESNIALMRKRKKVTWTGHTLCTKCLPKYVTEGKEKGKRSRGRKRKKPPNDLTEKKKIYTIILKRKHSIAPSEEATDL